MKTLLSIFACFVSLTMVAQTTTQSGNTTKQKTESCYDQWYSLFKERGATKIVDGAQEVIISIRNEYDYAECFLGKIDVKDEKLASRLQIQKIDGTYEEFDKRIIPDLQDAEGIVKEGLRSIKNGMSESFTLTDGEKVRIFFYKSLAVKAKANKKAPPPSELIKN